MARLTQGLAEPLATRQNLAWFRQNEECMKFSVSSTEWTSFIRIESQGEMPFSRLRSIQTW